MKMKVSRAFELQTIQQIKLAQTKHQPPAGQRHCKHDPQSDQGDYDSIAFGSGVHSIE